jgi:ubiquitin carboxyl-terminal hydrolase 4/11/15
VLHDYLQARNHIQPPPAGVGDLDVFKVTPINSTWSNYYGTVKAFQDNDVPLDLDDKESVACEFNRDNRRKYFNDRIDEKVLLDSTACVINETGGKDLISLIECLRLFTTEEQLSANDAWYCTECKEFREAFKKFDIWSAPKLLVVHLKRFSAVNRVWRERLDNLIDFPIDNLDLTEFVIGPKEHPPIYDLYAVSNHFGGMGGGHYTAYARHRDDNSWYRYDDSSVSPANPSEIVSRAAYVLFYKRRDVSWAPFDISLDKIKPEQSSEDSEDTDDSEMEVENNKDPATAPNPQ